MTQTSPTPARVAQHLLTATVAMAYLIAASMQIRRDNLTLTLINLAIATLLIVITHLNIAADGQHLTNYSRRQHIRRLRRNRVCGWCGENIEAHSSAIAYRGAINGEQFAIHHHPECDDATHDWLKANTTNEKQDLPYPTPGSMQRGQPHERQTTNQ